MTERLGSYHLVEPLDLRTPETWLVRKDGQRRALVLKRYQVWLAGEAERLQNVLARQTWSPYLVRRVDASRDGKVVHVVSENVAGRDLGKLLSYLRERAQRLPLPVAAYVGMQLCRAFQTVVADTTLECVAWNPQPSHVRLTFSGEVKLVDLPTALPRPPMPGFPRIAVRFLSPSKVRGLPDPRADVWAVGVMLCELFTGGRLFVGEDLLQTLDEILSSTPPLAHQLAPGLPAPLSEALRRALARVPAERLEFRALEQALAPHATPGARAELARWLGEAFGDEVGSDLARLRRCLDLPSPATPVTERERPLEEPVIPEGLLNRVSGLGDKNALLVLGDWLLSQGSARGHLLSVQAAAEYWRDHHDLGATLRAPEVPEAEDLLRLRDRELALLAGHPSLTPAGPVRLRWSLGWVSEALFDHELDVQRVQELLEHPSMRYLRRLTLLKTVAGLSHPTVEELVLPDEPPAEVRRTWRLPRLRALRGWVTVDGVRVPRELPLP